MIEFFLMITMYIDGGFHAGIGYKTLEQCELAKKLEDYKYKFSFVDYTICKKVSLNITKPPKIK